MHVLFEEDGAFKAGTMLADKSETPALDEFRAARRREKESFAQINQELVNTFVTALERELQHEIVGLHRKSFRKVLQLRKHL